MPVRNEQDHLEESVGHVLGQEYPAGVEVVLAVGPSQDATMEIAARLAKRDSRVAVVPNPSGSIPAANNLALKASRYPIVARVDGHAMLPPRYLLHAVRVLEATGADDVGGIMAAEGVTPFERAVAWSMRSPCGVGSASFHTGGAPGPADTVYLGVYRRSSLERVGGYDESYQVAEDWELNHRIRQAGGLIWFDPALAVTYRPRSSLRGLAHQYFCYGRWRRAIARHHRGTVNVRYLAPPCAITGLVAGSAAGMAGLAGRHAWLRAGFAVPGAYTLTVLSMTAAAARSLPPGALVRLPLVLVTMHLSWGAGFLTSPRALTPHPASRTTRARRRLLTRPGGAYQPITAPAVPAR